MKNKLLAFVCLLALVSCAKEDLGILSGTLGQDLRLKNGQTVRYNTSPAEAAHVLQLKLENVRDSRCPTDAVCVTYGQAQVEFRVGPGEGAGEVVTMCVGECGAGLQNTDTATVVVNASQYRIILQEIAPHPKLKQKSGTVKEVRLKVERL
jgi:hypothetical protein